MKFDAVFSVLQKLQVLPALTFRVWMSLCGIALAVTVVHGLGSRVFDWWPYSSDIALACITVFVALSLTPLHFPPRTVFVVRHVDATDWVEVSERDAMRCKADGGFVVRRVVVFKGQIVDHRDV